jgi:hypothetical protein
VVRFVQFVNSALTSHEHSNTWRILAAVNTTQKESEISRSKVIES